MSQFFSDARDFFSERFGSPFWISTVVSWCVWNWKVSITAIFETENFTVIFLEEYFSETAWSYHLLLPLLSGLIYATLSGSLKETLEIAAKIFRDQISKWDSNNNLYNTISKDTYDKKVGMLERQIDRISKRIAESESVIDKNDALQTEIEKTKTRDRETVEVIRNNIVNKNLDDELRKLRFLKELHDQGFALTISEEELESSSENEYDIEIVEDHENLEETYDPKNISETDADKSNLLGELLKEQKDFNDPNSIKTIFATLLLARARTKIDSTISPESIGLKDAIFEQCTKILADSKLVIKTGERTTITNKGIERLNKLRNELKNDDITYVIDETSRIVKKSILSLLKNQSFSEKQLYQKTPFHPDLPEIIKELEKDEKIHLEGQLYFSGPNSSGPSL